MTRPGRIPRPDEAADVRRRRRRVVGVVSVAGGALLGTSLSTPPGSRKFYVLTSAVAATWTVGGLASGPVHLGREPGPFPGRARWADRRQPRPSVAPVLVGVAAFVAFYGCALVALRIPFLDRAIRRVLRYEQAGASRAVLLTTLVNGVAEEVFFRGALYSALGRRHPVAYSTLVYSLATAFTRNPALIAASGVMGVVFARQRRSTGGIQAPVLTHVTWSTLMLRYLPRLFRPHPVLPTG